tara:strand:- start:437 stop:649 length:213 start_codon:yes stop_codon:yes gene_type:complete
MKILHLPKKSFKLRFKVPHKIQLASKKIFSATGHILHIDNGIGTIEIKSKNLEAAKQYLEDLIEQEVEYV